MQKKFLVALLASAALAGQASAATFDFPSENTSWYSATNGSGTIPNGGATNYMWTAGDYVSQLVTNTGLTSVTSYSGSFTILNVLNQTLNVDAVINGTTVGSFAINGCGYCSQNQLVNVAFSFGAVAGVGDDYTVAYVFSNTIASGSGSIKFLDGGSGTLENSVPEPATWAMLLAGFGAVGYGMRRKQAVTVRYA
jgi:hypothetical protein